MKLNRQLQKAILEKLAAAYPGIISNSSGGERGDFLKNTFSPYAYLDIYGNLRYLQDHQLLKWEEPKVGGPRNMEYLKITHKGMDFLENDGGLTAILGVVTIKIHDDTLKRLIEAKILQSDLAQPDKKRWLDQLRELPAETTKHLVLKLVDLGLANGPAAIAAIGTYLSN